MSTETTETKTDPKAKDTKQIRMLIDIGINGIAIPAGRVAIMPAGVAKSYIDAGSADDNDAAIEYALSEHKDVIDPFAKPE